MSAGTSGYVPPRLVTVTLTDPVPAGATAVAALFAWSLVMLAAGFVPKSTALTPARLVPEMTTEVPPVVRPVTGGDGGDVGEQGRAHRLDSLLWACGAGLELLLPTSFAAAWCRSRAPRSPRRRIRRMFCRLRRTRGRP